MGLVNVVKYSGNNFGAPFLLAQNLDPTDPGTRYSVHPMFGEGSTWIIPEFVGDNYMRIKEFGTPIIQNIQYTYTEPKRVLLGVGRERGLGAGHGEGACIRRGRRNRDRGDRRPRTARLKPGCLARWTSMRATCCRSIRIS